MTLFDDMMKRAATADGFIAALDQSGGSTPKALQQYGVPDDVSDTLLSSCHLRCHMYEYQLDVDIVQRGTNFPITIFPIHSQAYVEGEESMYKMVHEMRTRMITSPSFSGDKILGAILFEDTMEREIEGIPTGDFLWEKKGIIPFIKCDKGLAPEENGVQLMKPMPELDDLLKKSVEKNMFGTKMRSVIKKLDDNGIKAIVDQQFEIARQILAAGLCPILEPEVDITSPEKEAIEEVLKVEMLKGLNSLDEHQNVMIKLSLPTKVNLYKELIAHPRCVRVVALSGGYPRNAANEILSKQEGMIASFSRALLEGLGYSQAQSDFDETLGATIDSIFQASKAP
jgi:fructose-bisphosphate aldolase, class I